MHTKLPALLAIADDHPLTLQSLQHHIERMQDVTLSIIATNGAELIQQIEDSEQRPDLCIMDIQMPRLDGFDTLEYLKKKWPDIKVLIYTGFDQELYRQRMMVGGANAFVSKMRSQETLTEAILSVLQTGMYQASASSLSERYQGSGRYLRPVHVTPREKELLQQIDTARTYEEIGKSLGLSQRTVESIRDGLFAKLDVHSRQELTRYAIIYGYVLTNPPGLPTY